MSDGCDCDPDCCGDIDCGECCLCCCEAGCGGGGDDCFYYGGSSSGHGSNAPCHSGRCCIILAVLILLAGVALTIAALVVHPVHLELQDASLARLALTGPNGTALAYDVSLLVAMHNRNWAMRAVPGGLDAELLFEGELFTRTRLVPEMSSHGIRPGKTEPYHVAVAGETTQLGSAALAEFVKESAAAGGVFRLEVKLSGDVRYPPHREVHRLEATCPLELPLSSAAAVTRFTKVKCV